MGVGMGKEPGQADRKPLHWVGTSNDDLCEMPEEVRIDFGRRLNLAQRGRMPPNTKAWQGQGSGVFQMSREFDNDAYRAIYVAKFQKATYVLHAFQKKAKTGRKTDKKDVDAVEIALKAAEEHYKANYEKDEKQ